MKMPSVPTPMPPTVVATALVSGKTIARVVAEAGPPLGSEGLRMRPIGRIGGGVGGLPAPALVALGQALGPLGTLLSEESGALVADHDACRLGSVVIDDPRAWRQVIGAGQLAEVRGAFALAWREPDGALTLARDPIGERPLFYARVPPSAGWSGGWIFASSIHALLASGLVPRRPCLAAIVRYLCYAYVPGRETLVEGVYEVLPGEQVRLLRGVAQIETFWELPPEPREFQTEADLVAMLRERLEEAVLRRLPAGESVGASLSGGLDSSLVAALAAKHHDAPLHTFSITFGAKYPDELAFSGLLAAHVGSHHHILELPAAAVLAHLDQAIALLSEPIGDPLTVPNALLFREAARHVGVVLNGEGGDPCFGGPKNLPMVLGQLYGAGVHPEGNRAHARESDYLRAHQRCFDDLPALLGPELARALTSDGLAAELAPRFADPRYPTFVNKLMAINVAFKGAHHILPKVDALAAAMGVRARSPLFDQDVVAAAFAIPPRLKLKGSVEKYVLKQAVADILPRAILDRPKSGMLVPVEGWFKGPLLPLATERLLDSLATMVPLQRSYLEALLGGRLPGLRPRRGIKIWQLVTLEAWLREVLFAKI